MSPFVNLYFCLCVSAMSWCPRYFAAEDVKQKLDQATFLQRSIHRSKLQPKTQPSDMQVIATTLSVRIAQLINCSHRHGWYLPNTEGGPQSASPSSHGI